MTQDLLICIELRGIGGKERQENAPFLALNESLGFVAVVVARVVESEQNELAGVALQLPQEFDQGLGVYQL